MNIDKALKFLLKEADEAEIFFSRDNSKIIETKKGEVEIYKEGSSSGYGIRIIKDKRMGFAFSNELTEEVLEKALKTARIAEKDEYLSFPTKQKYKIATSVDKKILELDPEDAMGFLKLMIEPCKRLKVTPTTGAVVWSGSEYGIYNSHGLSCEDSDTAITCHLSTAAKDGEVSSGLYFDVSRKLDIDFRAVGEEAARLAKDSLGAKKIGNIKTNVILKPHAATELFENTLIPSFSAENVQRNRSFLRDKLGEKIFSEINIIDDGTLRGGLMTYKSDTEGVSSQRTELVSEGVLKGYLYDTYTATKAGRKSTGNAERGSYASLPKVDSSNFVISGGGNIGEGLVVHGLIGAHTSNPVSGDFSVETRNAFLYGKPVKKAIISGNIFELFKKVSGFGKDYKQIASVRTPTIEFPEVMVVS